MKKVNFFFENITVKIDKNKTKTWIRDTITEEGFTLNNVNYIFCDDQYLLDINQKYLNHDSLTDIITFDNSESPFEIEGDIFISIQRVKENAELLNIDFNTEIARVIIHGILHLMGYKDKSLSDKNKMRLKEDYYLKNIIVPRGTL